jgi:NAD(P)-dependent dehydrogenase (short-subunit alcohol dehydrogenase family)
LVRGIGPVETFMYRQGVTTPDAKAFMTNISPFKRIGTVDDLGAAVALIASESARWISGQSIRVDGK